MAAQQQAASVLQSFPFRAAVLALCVALLPLLPAQAPDVGAGGAGQAFLAKVWELLHLLFVGIAVSYGLFSRKNSADDGRAGAVAAAAEKHAAAGPEPAKADARYAWRMFRDSIAPFDDDDDDDVLAPDSPPGHGGGGTATARSWRAPHRPVEPVVVVSTGGGGVRIGQAADAQAPLSLPVRTLKPQPAQDASAGAVETPRARRRRSSQDLAAGCARDETVLASPIPWRSRSGRLEARRPASPSSSPSPKRLSPASSLSGETLAKASEEEYYAKAKRRSPYRSSSISSSPPAPPPPPFLVHGYHPATAECRSAAAKSFKEELQHHSMKGRGEDHYSPMTSSIGISAYNSSNSSAAKPRSSFDGGSSSSVSVGKSVRTFRAREPAAALQDQSQELPDDAGDDRDALDVHGSEEPYGYRAYQSIHRFQYERSGSDPILGGVAVSSDETESSDDDDDNDVSGGGYSTRESTPEVDENEVDKKAEEFIARFREQIRRQRIESIKKSAGPRGVKHHGK